MGYWSHALRYDDWSIPVRNWAVRYVSHLTQPLKPSRAEPSRAEPSRAEPSRAALVAQAKTPRCLLLPLSLSLSLSHTHLARWSVCHAVTSSRRADEDYHQTVSKICSPDFAYEALPRGTSAELADLLRNILCVDVKKRFSVEQIAQHVWMSPGGVYTAPEPAAAPSPRPAKNWETLWPAPPPPAEDFFTSPPSSLGSSAGWRSGSAGQGSSGVMQYHALGGGGSSGEMDDGGTGGVGRGSGELL